MKIVLCKISFSSPANPEQSLEILGEADIDQILSEKNELVAIETRFLSENKIVVRHSILHKADISHIQIFKEKQRYTFDKTNLRLMSQIHNFKGMKA